MVDTFRPLELGEGGRAVDDGAYAWQAVVRAGPVGLSERFQPENPDRL